MTSQGYAWALTTGDLGPPWVPLEHIGELGPKASDEPNLARQKPAIAEKESDIRLQELRFAFVELWI